MTRNCGIEGERSMTDLNGKVALVTGGASGIGRASALAFAQAGAAVAIADLDPANGDAVVREIEAAGGRAIFIATDATEEAQVARMVERTVAELGGLDIAFNNVGRGEVGATIVSTTAEKWDWILATSLKATWLSMKYQIPVMQAAGGGCIVNMASTAGISPQISGSPAYSAAKAGVVQLTRFAAKAHAPDNIRVNSVAPGLTSTPTVEAWFTEEMKHAVTSRDQFTDRLTTPEEVAATVLFLASPGASMITGVNIPVCGGLP